MLAVLGWWGQARADDSRPPVRLELGDCLAPVRDDVQRAIRVEVGDATDDPDAVAVRVDCAADGLAAGVVLEVRRPGSERRYRYALDWRAQPLDARPRLVGLAVAEAVDASRIELTAIAEPAPPAIVAPVIAAAASAWSFAVMVDWRAFSAPGGATLVGVGVAPTRQLSPRLRLATDLIVDGATVISTSGAVVVRSLSSAPRVVYRAGARVHGELGVGVRVGAVSLQGEAIRGSSLAGQRVVRAWLGPIATLAIGAALTPNVAMTASVELGRTVADATPRDLGQPVASLSGTWTSVGLGVAVTL